MHEDRAADEARHLDLIVAAFRYALQSALERLAECERAAKRTFAERRTALAAARTALDEVDDTIGLTRARLAIDAPTSAAVFIDIDRRLASLQAARVRRIERLALAQRELEQARGELETALLRHAALARHRARRYDAYRHACDLREAAEFDEQNALSHARSTRFA